ncbi:hypothetical protein MYSTI_07221 [Myxococcus stipitatus DSM 14675]|uniref:Lipoprotein n=1 Tax=Myxococcus stipitatus (strain DSM 14675 / JCM 12634 / Mx s8) TaxID=1278073 RepID=L7UKF0_MYXSD|nr:hypothetical protein [Myxococcus stipitatus]AGC48493.1 hypothetical protein MYSTI_07221 [Myxococcus stipitatus DSM 14675]
MGSSWVRLCFIAWVLGGCAARQSVPWGADYDAAFWRYCTSKAERPLPLPSVIPEGALAVSFKMDLVAGRPDLRSDRFKRCVFSTILYTMGERGLWPAGWDSEVYRFTWSPSFSAPLMIRVERRGAVYVLHAEHLGGYASWLDAPRTQRSRLLLPSEWNELHRKLQAFSFWTRSSRPSAPYGVEYLDGADWLLEGVQRGRYKAYLVWSPDDKGQGGAFREACLYLLELSGLAIPPTDFY